MSFGLKRGLHLWVLINALAAFSSAAAFSGKCVGIGDGDTISVLKSGAAVRIRLEGIDCPELGQDFGTAARKFTSGLVFGRIVQVREVTVDSYGRTVARVFIDGTDLSLELVKAGLAWHFTAYSSDPVLAVAELRARQSKTGLWSMPDPIPPWVYRRTHRRLEYPSGDVRRAQPHVYNDPGPIEFRQEWIIGPNRNVRRKRPQPYLYDCQMVLKLSPNEKHRSRQRESAGQY